MAYKQPDTEVFDRVLRQENEGNLYMKGIPWSHVCPRCDATWVANVGFEDRDTCPNCNLFVERNPSGE